MLPNYVVLEPRYFDLPDFPANDDHPSHDVSEGQKMLKVRSFQLKNQPKYPALQSRFKPKISCSSAVKRGMREWEGPTFAPKRSGGTDNEESENF